MTGHLEYLLVPGQSNLGLRKGLYECLAVSLPNLDGKTLLTLRHLPTGKVHHVSSWWFPNGVLRAGG